MTSRRPRNIGEVPGKASSMKSIILVAAVIIMTACFIAIAIDSDVFDADPVTSGQCGENLTWTVSNDTLTIEGFGAMYDYTYSQTRWGGNGFSSVVLPQG